MSRFDGHIRELKAKFQASDTSGDGRLSYDELSRLLKKGKPDMRDSDIRVLFDAIDKNHDNKIDFYEFVDFVYTTGKDLVKLECAQQKKAPGRSSSDASLAGAGGPGLQAPDGWTFYGMGAHPEFAATVELEEIDWETVHTVYAQYSGDNHSMEGAEFMKLCRDARLIAGDFTMGDVDVVFTTVTHGQRHMKKKHFREAIKLVAKKRKVPTSHIRGLIASVENSHTNLSAFRRGSKRSGSRVSDPGRKSSWHGDSTVVPSDRLDGTVEQRRTSCPPVPGGPDQKEVHGKKEWNTSTHVA